MPFGLDLVHGDAKDHRLGLRLQLTGLTHGEVQGVVQEPQQGFGGVHDGAGEGLGVRGEGLTLQQAGDRQDPGHGGADLASEHLHELAPVLAVRGAAVGAGLQGAQQGGLSDQAGIAIVVDQDHRLRQAAAR